MWFAILSSKEVRKDRPVGVVRFGRNIVLWRDENGKVNAIEDSCVHRRARLSAGKVINGRLQCPFHGFEYDGDGRVKLIPALGRSYRVPERFSVKAYNVAEKAGMIWMWFGEGEPGGEPRFFEDIDKKFACAEIQETWNVPFPRAVENQLDVMHLPFVHRTTIGRGNRTLVNGPVVKWIDGDSFVFYVFNEVDRGQIAKKPGELEGLESRVYLEFIFPNVWQNHISEKVRVVAFFVPVTKEKTMIYLRFYIKATGIRPLDRLIAKLGMRFNKVVLHQDRRVVETQEWDIRKDSLVQGDLPIMEFRKRLYREKKLVEFLFG
ncbi:aromatic ring-hydroxylating oxygenase subunit alpha [Thermococcus zilligii]|uniref:aromatic ring-hydroxylating oxygenase subunit alpha n=1 Tax=Thermococcus zilligii TaxID=54076 RepID=UPI000299DF0D|nr:aromatic ring-hydroxylating dioxygenase subunit alpha [Thermococcus zilligii]